jgi:hypothetical protein
VDGITRSRGGVYRSGDAGRSQDGRTVQRGVRGYRNSCGETIENQADGGIKPIASRWAPVTPNPAEPEPNRTSKTFFYRDEQDIQDKNTIGFMLNQKPFILLILSIPVNFVF